MKLKFIFAICIVFMCILIPDLAISQTLPDSTAKKIDSLFKEWNTPNSPGAVVGVIQNESLIYAKGYGMADLEHYVPITPSTIFYMASVSKQFTGYSIVLLARQGKINLDEDIHVYLPSAPDFGKKITVRQLLNHTSGIRDYISLPAISGLGMDGMLTQDLAVNIIKRQRTLNFNPGEQFSYSNSNYVLLAEMVETVSGQSFRAFADSAIFKPLGMTHSRFQEDYTELIPGRAFSYEASDDSLYKNVYQNVYTLGDGGLFTNLTDMAKWVNNFFNPIAGDYKDISQLIQKGVLTDGTQINYALGIGSSMYNNYRKFSHSGGLAGYRTFLSVFPDLKMGFLVFGNVANFNSSAISNELADLFISDQPKNVTPEEKVAMDSKKSILIDTDRVKELEGSYIADNGFHFQLRLRGGKLYADTDEQDYLLLQNAEDTFSLEENPKVKFYFGKSADQKTDGLFIIPDQAQQKLKKYNSNFEPTDSKLQEYSGSYYSQELDCSYNMEVKNHQLMLTSNKYRDAELILAGEDNLIDKSEVLSHLQIIRDNTNKIIGFEVNSGRVMHLVFDKIK